MEEAVNHDLCEGSLCNCKGNSDNKTVMINDDECSIDPCEKDDHKNEADCSKASDIKKGVSLQRVSFIF